MGQLAMVEASPGESPADLLALMEMRLGDLERAERHLALATESVAAATELVSYVRVTLSSIHAELESRDARADS